MVNINKKNPFKYNMLHHYSLTYDLIKNKQKRVLDFGSGEGQFIGNLKNKANNLYGYEVAKERILIAKKNYPYVKFYHGKVGEKLPYKNDYFDSIFVFHVLEHVDSEVKILNELYRILRKDGILFIASPYKGLFSWADLANLRYNFPIFHKIAYIIFYGKQKYYKLFRRSKNQRLHGDSSSNRNTHKHYTKEELNRLLSKRFLITEFLTFSFIYPFLLIPYNIFLILSKKESKLINYLFWLDNKIKLDKFSYNFLLTAKKLK